MDGEGFAGLNIRVFNPIEIFAEILSRCLDHKCLLFSIIEKGTYIHEKIFAVLLKTVKNANI